MRQKKLQALGLRYTTLITFSIVVNGMFRCYICAIIVCENQYARTRLLFVCTSAEYM